MLRTPSCSMKRSDSSRAPAPMAIMPMTEPTPNTMPSAVSSVRVFCARRLPKAWTRSENTNHLLSAFIGPPEAGVRAFLLLGISTARSSRPSSIPVMTAWLSLRRTIVTSGGVNAPSGA